MPTYSDLVTAIRAAPAGPRPFTYVRDGRRSTRPPSTWSPPSARRSTRAAASSAKVSAAGLSGQTRRRVLRYSLAESPAAAVWYVGQTVRQTFTSIAHFPQRIPNLVKAIDGGQRDPDTPVSVSAPAGSAGSPFQLGAHGIDLPRCCSVASTSSSASSTCCRCCRSTAGTSRSPGTSGSAPGCAARRGRPDPGRVDYNKLLPLTYVVVLLFVGLTVLTLTADIVNPIRLQP